MRKQTNKQTNISQNNNNKANTAPRQTVKKCKNNVNLIYSGHALSLTLSIAQFTGMPLKQRKQIFQMNVT